jgi:hypothetical protein
MKRNSKLEADKERWFSLVKQQATATKQRQITRQTYSFGLDGVSAKHFPREDLLSLLYSKVIESRFVLLNSPAASGKTSLIKLFIDNYAEDEGIQSCYISCIGYNSIKELLIHYGIHPKETISDYYKDAEKTYIVFLDDAQSTFEDKIGWTYFVKNADNFPENVKFVISATHLLTGGIDSPIEFQSIVKLSREDFLLNEDESYDFLKLFLPEYLKNNQTIINMIQNECAGLIGALRLSAFYINDAFSKYPESENAKYYQYYFSNNLLNNMARCFGSGHPLEMKTSYKEYLLKCCKSPNPAFIVENESDAECLKYLGKSGIIVENQGTFGFSSPLAERYYFNRLYPRRANNNPDSVVDLVQAAIKSMSSSALRASIIPNSCNTPNEGTFQHLFMNGLLENTTPACSICPELSRRFETGEKIPGEIDFYVNGDLGWGIELLVKGSDLSQRINRFESDGKYSGLQAKDYAVVDFRCNVSGSTTNVRRHPKRISVFFKYNDFSSCECIIGNNTEIVVLALNN